MVSTLVGAFLALDALAFVLAGVVAVFFWRTHRVLPGRGFEVLALAFAALGVGYAAVAVSHYRLLPGIEVVDALRLASSFLGVVLIVLAYAARRVRWRLRTVEVLAAAVVAVGALYLLLYLAVPPFVALPDPLVYLPWVRLVQALALGLAAWLVATEVEGRSLADYQVPIAFVLFAVEKYTVAILLLHGVLDDVFVPYAWRFAGLLVLLRVVRPLGGWERATA